MSFAARNVRAQVSKDSSRRTLALSEENQVLIKLKEDQKLPWKEITKELEKTFCKTFKSRSLAVRYSRLKARNEELSRLQLTRNRIPEELNNGEWLFDCARCGVYGKNHKTVRFAVACKVCNVWQHSKCVVLSQSAAKDKNFDFICARCTAKTHTSLPARHLHADRPIFVEHEGGAGLMRDIHFCEELRRYPDGRSCFAEGCFFAKMGTPSGGTQR